MEKKNAKEKGREKQKKKKKKKKEIKHGEIEFYWGKKYAPRNNVV